MKDVLERLRNRHGVIISEDAHRFAEAMISSAKKLKMMPIKANSISRLHKSQNVNSEHFNNNVVQELSLEKMMTSKTPIPIDVDMIADAVILHLSSANK